MAVLVAVGVALWSLRPPAPQLPPTDPAVKDLAGAIEAYKTIRAKSLPGLSPEAARRGAVEGMVRQVDEFSAYFPPERAEVVFRRLQGRVVETGLRVRTQGERLLVVGPLAGSPAHAAGLYAGMEILAIDGVRAKYLPLKRVREILQADDGKAVTLMLRDRRGRTLLRQLRPKAFEVTTVQGIVRTGPEGWLHALDRHLGIYYIRITEFVPQTPGDFHEAYRRLEDLGGLVLDLRDNPGGELQKAAEIVDRLLDRGVIVRTVWRDGRQYVHHAHPAGTYRPVPLVVLIDEKTASAAEIVAAALQRHGRGVRVGRPTYGKWCVQTPVPLGYGLGMVYLTTGRYILPGPSPASGPASRTTRPAATAPAWAGRPRVYPDVPVRLTAWAAERLERLRMQAVVVPPPAQEAASVGPQQPQAGAERLKRAILRLDAQLAEALRLLREGRVPVSRQPGEPLGRGRPGRTERCRTGRDERQS